MSITTSGQYVINTHVEINMKLSRHPMYPALPYLVAALLLLLWTALT